MGSFGVWCRLIGKPLRSTESAPLCAADGGTARALLAAYLSLEQATTVLETLATYSRSTAAGRGYKLLKIEYAGSSIQAQLDALPRGWDRWDSAASARGYGNSFLREARAGVLLVPCVFLKAATNVLPNPLHPDSRKAKIVSSEALLHSTQTRGS